MEEKENLSIGQEIIIFRSKNNWTQRELAKRLKTTERTVIGWESGASIPRNAWKVKLAEVFGLPEYYFLSKMPQEKNSVTEEEDERAAIESGIDDLLGRMNKSITEEKKKMLVDSFISLSETRK